MKHFAVRDHLANAEFPVAGEAKLGQLAAVIVIVVVVVEAVTVVVVVVVVGAEAAVP